MIDLPVSSTLTRQGIYTFKSFERTGLTRGPEYLVDGLLGTHSVNLLVGDSGLGKTPLGVTLGIAVASGRPFLGRSIQRGRVLIL